MTPWILATRNSGKLRELRALFESRGIAVVDLLDVGVALDETAEEAIESYGTFEENALAKARYFSAQLPGRIVVADDSGLAVDALGGDPGVRSKRWSGRADLSGHDLDGANNALLRGRMAGVDDRAAKFVCAAAWTDSATECVVRGEVPGRILDDPSGANGFGYDPYFFVTELDMTMADATLGRKELVSHRGRAFNALLEALAATESCSTAG